MPRDPVGYLPIPVGVRQVGCSLCCVVIHAHMLCVCVHRVYVLEGIRVYTRVYVYMYDICINACGVLPEPVGQAVFAGRASPFGVTRLTLVHRTRSIEFTQLTQGSQDSLARCTWHTL